MTDASFFTRFTRGFVLPIRAADILLSRRGLKRYALLPLLFNAVLYAGVIALAVWALLSWEAPQVAWEFWGPVGSWLAAAVNGTAGTVKWLVALPLLLITCYFTFTMTGLVVAAPLNDILSDRVERAITEPRPESTLSLARKVWIMVLGILFALRIVIIQIGAMALTLPFLLIPGVGFLPLLLVAGYFTGIGLFDVPMARHDLEPRRRRPALRRRRAEIFGLGVAVECLFLIPFAALLILPLGVTAGTILFCRTDWEGIFESDGEELPESFHPPALREE